MKKIFSFFLALVVSVCSITSVFAICADSDAFIEIESVEAEAGKTVDVNVVIGNNPGITALSFDISYDTDKLTLVKATDGKLLGTSTATFGNDVTAIPYRLCWDDLSAENNTENGTVAVLTFKVNDTADGSANIGIKLNQNSTFNVGMENVPFNVKNGSIKIKGEDVTNDAALINIENASGRIGEKVDVNVLISNNPGITALSFDISYDSEKLKLIKAVDGKILGTSTATFGNDVTAIPYRLCWDDISTENNVGNGVVAVLTFEILSDAMQETAIDIKLNQNSTFNVDIEDVHFNVRGGIVSITEESQQTTSAVTTTQTTITTSTTAEPESTTTIPSITTTTAEPITTIVTTSTSPESTIITTTINTTTLTEPTTTTAATTTITTNTEKTTTILNTTTTDIVAPTTAVTTVIPPNVTVIPMGDVNGDNKVDASDASRVLVEYAILSTGGDATLVGELKIAADVNEDGKVDASDASVILVFYSYLSTGGEETDMKIWIKLNKD